VADAAIRPCSPAIALATAGRCEPYAAIPSQNRLFRYQKRRISDSNCDNFNPVSPLVGAGLVPALIPSKFTPQTTGLDGGVYSLRFHRRLHT